MIQSNEIARQRKFQFLQSLMLVSILFAVISTAMSKYAMNKWIKTRKSVVVMPNNIDLPYPFLQKESAAHCVQADSEVKNFVSMYLRLTKDYSTIADFKAVTNDTRYIDSVRFSENLRTALEMTAPGSIEWQDVNSEYSRSNEIYKTLVEKKVSYRFRHDGMFVFGDPVTGGYRVLVTGKYYAHWDAEKSEIPAKFLGYKLIDLIIVRSTPVFDENLTGFLNKSGLKVVISTTSDIDLSTKYQIESTHAATYVK